MLKLTELYIPTLSVAEPRCQKTKLKLNSKLMVPGRRPDRAAAETAPAPASPGSAQDHALWVVSRLSCYLAGSSSHSPGLSFQNTIQKKSSSGPCSYPMCPEVSRKQGRRKQEPTHASPSPTPRRLSAGPSKETRRGGLLAGLSE